MNGFYTAFNMPSEVIFTNCTSQLGQQSETQTNGVDSRKQAKYPVFRRKRAIMAKLEQALSEARQGLKNGRVKKIMKPKAKAHVTKQMQDIHQISQKSESNNWANSFAETDAVRNVQQSLEKNEHRFLNQETTDASSLSRSRCRSESYETESKGDIFSQNQLFLMLSSFDSSSFLSGVTSEYLTIIQSEMNPKLRAVLINWMLQVHQKFSLRLQTFFTAVNLFDRYCSQVAVPIKKFQLLAITVLFIASKFEEVRPPKLSCLLSVSENHFLREEVFQLEGEIMQAIHFKVSTSSPLQLLEVLCQIRGIPSCYFLTAAGFLVSCCFDLRMNTFGVEKIVESSLILAMDMNATDIGLSSDGSCHGSELSRSNLGLTGEQNKVCMRYMSLIVLNLERAGLLALRKVFPEATQNLTMISGIAN